MPTTQTSIANAALRMIGQDRITSFSEGEAGRILTDIYEDKVQYLLRHHLWNFAIKRASLYASNTAPEWGFLYSYQLPEDCVRVLNTSEDEYVDSDKWQVEGSSIVTDIEAPLKIRYVSRADESDFDPLFVECLSAMLAAELAQPITGRSDLQAEMQGEAERKLRLAKAADGQEGSPPVFRRATWVQAKFVPFGGRGPGRWGS